jgi:hypothetical protein
MERELTVERTRAGLDAEQLEDLGETGARGSRGKGSKMGRGADRGGRGGASGRRNRSGPDGNPDAVSGMQRSSRNGHGPNRRGHGRGPGAADFGLGNASSDISAGAHAAPRGDMARADHPKRTRRRTRGGRTAQTV